MTSKSQQNSIIASALVLVLLVLPLAVVAEPSPMRIGLDNGIVADIYTSELLGERLIVESDSRGIIPLDDGGYLSVVTDIEDPIIQNKGDGSFHPYSTDQVIDALNEINYPRLDVNLQVFLLPFPRANLLVSSVSGDRMFLSPQVNAISREGASYVVAHEMGHVFQNQYLPEDAHREWETYRHKRRITNRSLFHDEASHANRPAEIFAEDFRVLFGGSTAFFGGLIENTTLPSPIHIAGLDDFFAGLAKGNVDRRFIVGFANFPNPFNPETEFHIELAPDFIARGERLSVRIYDVRGALVRELYSTQPSSSDVRVSWDGLDSNGREVASSTYFGVAQAGADKMSQKLLMIK